MQHKHIWYTNFVLAVLQITEMKVKHLQSPHTPLKPCFFTLQTAHAK